MILESFWNPQIKNPNDATATKSFMDGPTKITYRWPFPNDLKDIHKQKVRIALNNEFYQWPLQNDFMDGPNRKYSWIPSFYKTIWMAPNYKNFMNSPCTKLNNALLGIKTQKLGKMEKMEAVEKNSQKSLLGMPLASPGIQKYNPSYKVV